MNKLIAEIKRLYLQTPLSAEGDTHGLAPADPVPLAGDNACVRAMVLSLGHKKVWPWVTAIFQGVQTDMELPAPGVVISPQEGYQIWFSLAEAIPAVDAVRFLEGLQQKYLQELSPEQQRLCPSSSGLRPKIHLAPARDATSGQWSAFIDPSMGDLFCDEPGLDFPPNADRQADMLAALVPISPQQFQQAIAQLDHRLQPLNPTQSTKASLQASVTTTEFTHPRDFLLATMNNPQASLHDRIEAAKALQPYFTQGT